MRYITVLLIAFTISTVCKSQPSPNTPDPNAASAAKPAPANTPNTNPVPAPAVQTPPQVQSTLTQNDAVRIARAEMEQDTCKRIVEAHQKTLTTIQTAVVAIGSLVLALVGYIAFKNKKEYEDALKQVWQARDDAKEIRNEAKSACEKAEQWEEKARNICEKIDSLFHQIEIKSDEQAKHLEEKLTAVTEAKLKEIETKTQKSTQQMDAKAKEQRQISELWNDAMRLHNESKYEEACNKYAEIVKLKSDDYSAYNNWGFDLYELATLKGDEKLFEQACQKFEQAVNIKPNKYGAYNGWGIALAEWAKLKDDEKLFEQACQKFEQTIKIKTDYHEAYNNWGLALYYLAELKGSEKLFEQACQKYEQAVKIKADYHQAYYNWGAVLSELAPLKGDEKLFEQACQKFEQAVRIKADYAAYGSWGVGLLSWARRKTGTPEYGELLKQAEEKFKKAESLKKGSAAYNLACVYALRSDKGTCRKWFELCQETNDLPTREHAMKDSDLAGVRDEEWFKAIKWKYEK